MKQVVGPTFLIDKNQVIENVRGMAAKAQFSNAVLRPHFKTHQSAMVAGWMREEGVSHCAVSSPRMAKYFADAGWMDILIALPAQPGAIAVYNELATTVRLGVVGDSSALVEALCHGLTQQVDFWIEVDAGYGRTGVRWDNHDRLREMIDLLEKSKVLNLRGLIVHAGDSYDCRGKAEILAFYSQVKERVLEAEKFAEQYVDRALDVSFGDTPCCSVVEDLSEWDEIRAGNFVYYDLTQAQIGSCDLSQISVAVACPVIGVYPEKLIVHGGGVHFSKDMISYDGQNYFGQVVERKEGGWQPIEGLRLLKISQEHGTVVGDAEELAKYKLGDVLHVLPVHSCHTADCMADEPVEVL